MRVLGSTASITVLATTLCMLACSSLGVGCVVNEAEAPTRGVVVSGPPPAPVAEQRPAAPSPQSVWVGGYWHWTGIQYSWIPGHWDAPPPGATWSAPIYTARDGKYFYESGGWKPGDSAQSRNALR